MCILRHARTDWFDTVHKCLQQFVVFVMVAIAHTMFVFGIGANFINLFKTGIWRFFFFNISINPNKLIVSAHRMQPAERMPIQLSSWYGWLSKLYRWSCATCSTYWKQHTKRLCRPKRRVSLETSSW